MVCEFCVLFAQESRMNKLLTTITLLCFSIGATAQEKEIWACQQVEGLMLQWEDDDWSVYRVKAQPMLLTIDGPKSSFKRGDDNTALDCSVLPPVSRTACTSIGGAYYILIDHLSGEMGFSFLGGAMDRTDSLFSSAYNCTKF